METKVSLPYSQKPATCSYPESNPVYAPIQPLEDPFQYYPSFCAWVFQVSDPDLYKVTNCIY
jgi:hypothetical protein